MVTHPQKAALLQVEAQTCDLVFRKSDGADIGGHQVRALKERRVSEPDEPYMRKAWLQPTDSSI